MEALSNALFEWSGAEFQLPADWLVDQRLYRRAVEQAEVRRGLDPPSLRTPEASERRVAEPQVAYGPPGSTGEENVSIIAAPIQAGFRCVLFKAAAVYHGSDAHRQPSWCLQQVDGICICRPCVALITATSLVGTKVIPLNANISLCFWGKGTTCGRLLNRAAGWKSLAALRKPGRSFCRPS